jgi:hypothetical protein
LFVSLIEYFRIGDELDARHFIKQVSVPDPEIPGKVETLAIAFALPFQKECKD